MELKLELKLIKLRRSTKNRIVITSIIAINIDVGVIGMGKLIAPFFIANVTL